jgi:hypothetical protein
VQKFSFARPGLAKLKNGSPPEFIPHFHAGRG